jgi:hypothetical protein
VPIQSISFGVGGALLALLWLLLALALGLAIWAYRAPEPPIAGRIRATLATLRFVALALLVLTLFQPVMTVVGGSSGRPAVPVLVDLSRSMLLPADAHDDDASAERASGASTADRPEEGAQSGARQPAAGTRLDVARRVVREVVPALGTEVDVRLLGFGDETRELERGPDGDVMLAATGGATRLGPALSEVLGGDAASSMPLCLVISDGGVNAGTDPIAAAERLGVPVYVVPVSRDSVVHDVWIAECLANRSLFLDQETSVAIRLGSHLEGQARVRVVLEQDGRVLAGEHVELPAGDGDTELRLTFRPDRLGTQRLEVAVEPVRGELTAANNRRGLAVEVVEERLQVLVVADEVSWDLTFLRRVLDADRTLATTVLARLERGSDRYRPIGEGKIESLPTRAQELVPFGAVVLIGADPARLPAASRVALRAYVAEGGGLVVLTGRQGHHLRAWLDGELAGQLPVRAAAIPGGRGSKVAAELTAAGLVHPVTSLGEAPARAGALWGDLPPVELTARIEAALGGEVLVEAEVGGQQRPIVVAGPAGGGRALVVAAADIWRWDLMLRGRGRDATVFRRLWTEAVRWAAEGRLQSNLELFADRQMFLGGERATIAARLTGDRLQPVDDASVAVDVVGEDGETVTTVRLLPGETRGHYVGDAGFLPAGVYRLRGQAASGSTTWTAEGGHFMVDAADRDGTTPAASPDLLRRLASRSGGAVLAPDEAAERLGGLVAARRQQLAAFEIKLWNHPAVFVLFVVVLAAEWALRRRIGLA